jgi:hypothetical protein
MVRAFADHGQSSDHWITSIEPRGARIVDR